jgi:sec-independent protein translocase protein TatC
VNKSQGNGPAADVQMPFTSHLAELRSRLVKCCVAIGIAFLGCFAIAEQIFYLLTAPLRRVPVSGLTIIGTGVTEAFFTKMKVAFAAAIIVALPVLLWHVWQFVAPGLYEHEKRYTRSFVFFGSLFFLAGTAFCYEVFLQFGLEFLLRRYEAIQVQPLIQMGEYFSLVSRLVLAFGVMFQLPVVAYFLSRVGLIDHRFLIRHIRYAVIGIAILAAVLTPPDLISQVLFMVPLALLYAVSIIVAFFARQKGGLADGISGSR